MSEWERKGRGEEEERGEGEKEEREGEERSIRETGGANNPVCPIQNSFSLPLPLSPYDSSSHPLPSLHLTGIRMLAVAVLPISHETLQYGSDDGGITVKADHPDLNKKMEVRKRDQYRTE